MHDKTTEQNVTRVIKMLEGIFCATIIKRIICAILIAFEVDKQVIADKLGLSLKSVKKYSEMLNSGQTNQLLTIKGNSRKSELEDYKAIIFTELENGTYKNLRQISAMIERLTGLKRSMYRISVFLKKNGFQPLKVGLIPAKADVGQQHSFYDNILKPLMDSAKSNKIQLFFVDASHFVMGGYVGVIWSRVRRYVKTGSGRSRYNVLGALNFVTKKVETITNDTYITSTQIIALIDKLVANSIGKPIKLVLDNAKYQHCKAVMEYAAKEGVELIFLPTYSPNLNLIERLWKFVKAEVLNAAYHGTFQDFQVAIDGCIDQTDKQFKSQIDTLISEKVHFFDDNPVPNVSSTAAVAFAS